MSIYPIINYSQRNAGKITVTTLILCFLVLSVFVVVDTQYRGVDASSTATTSVTVINSPPDWLDEQGPREAPESSVNLPTNEGDAVTWVATARDPNVPVVGDGNEYWLLICKGTSTGVLEENFTRTAGGVPGCPNGEQWAISSITNDGEEATAVYTTTPGRDGLITNEDEVNEWYAVICDNDATNSRCNADDLRSGPNADNELNNGPESSPFYVNFRPRFSSFTAPEGTNPGAEAVWTSDATDLNTALADNSVKLIVCRGPGLTGEECDGGIYASSTLVADDPSVSYTLKNPKPNGIYDAYGYIVDAYGLAAPTTGTWIETRRQGVNRPLVVNNVAPVLESSSVSFYDLGEVTSGTTFSLDNPEDLTEGFKITFNTLDDNSCVTQGWSEELDVTDFPEMQSVAVNFYRSTVGMESCSTNADYDSNNCYTDAVTAEDFEASGDWNIVCTMDQTSCNGNTDPSVSWECEFPLWYNAEPSVVLEGNWLVSMTVTDVDDETGDLVEGDSGVDIDSFMAFRLDTPAIPYPALNVGEWSDLVSLTPILAIGNTGVNQNLHGTPMCPEFDYDLGAGSNFGCTVEGEYAEEVGEALIPARFQKFGVSGTPYGSATNLLPDELVSGYSAALYEVKVPKTVNPLSAGVESIAWGIEIPEGIVIADDYFGQNTFIGSASEPADW